MAKDDVEILGTIRPGGGDPPPPKKKSKKRKGWMIVGGLLVVVLTIFFVHRATTTKKPVPLPAMAPPLQKPGTVVSSNPEYRKKLAQQNALAARTAEKSGSSVLPTLGADTGNKDSLKELTNLEKSKKVSAPPPPDPEIERERREEAEARQRIQAAKIKSEDAAVTGEMRTVLSTWATQGEGLAVIAVAKSTGSAPEGGAKGSPAPKGTPAAATKKNVPIIPAGKILYGVVVNTLDSDNPGPVLVQAVGGRFDGTKFLGSFQRNHGKLTIQLNRVIYPDGESDSIGAYVVSPGAKLRSGLETDVDHHYLYRYGGLLASAFLQGFGEAAMYSNSTAYPSAYGMPIIGFNGMTFLQQSELGMGQAGMMLGSQTMNAFNRPPTVKLAANTPVGILIVAETGQKLPKGPAPKAAAPARSQAAPVPSMVPQPGYPMTPMSPYGGYGMPMMPMMP